MGRRDRLRKQAIIEGNTRSIVQDKRDLMFEVVKRATGRLFYDSEWDDSMVEDFHETVAAIVGEVLPDALVATGGEYFHLKDLTRGKDWSEMGCRIIKGVAARGTDTFRKADNKGEIWALRKSKAGRKLTGEWRLCVRCGDPFYVTRSRWQQGHHNRDCYWDAYREGTVYRQRRR